MSGVAEGTRTQWRSYVSSTPCDERSAWIAAAETNRNAPVNSPSCESLYG